MRFKLSRMSGRLLSFESLCPSLDVRVPRTGALCFCLLVLGAFASEAFGTVQSQPGDDVIPADSPFTVGVDEGLPDNGHSIDPFEAADPANPVAAEQTNFEGEYDVVVGKSGTGTLLISGGSDIRAEHLIIGDSEDPPEGLSGPPYYRDLIEGIDFSETTGVGRHGNGFVRIEGFSSLYNNDYTLLPPGFPPLDEFGSNRQTDADAKGGFDLFVGRWGSGTLQIIAGGRAEIHDVVSVGDQSGSTGLLVVDGVSSFLGNGGAEDAEGMIDNGANAQQFAGSFVVGRQGSGTANITNGGQVYSQAPIVTGGGVNTIFAGVIGSDPSDGAAVPIAGGNGYVYLDGSSSKWILGGSLQVGGFHNTQDAALPDREGIDAIYASNVGLGTVSVSNGAVVSILPPSGSNTASLLNELNLTIGRRGTVDLNGGRIEMQGGLTIGTNPQPVIEDVQLINDGLITGGGRIDTGSFGNRFFGQVVVNAGESLVVSATTTFLFQAPTHPHPLANWGEIKVLGTEEARAELAFDRVPESDDPDNAFHNFRLGQSPDPNRVAGKILAQDATLSFRSGLSNEGILAFTGGTNFVEGKVINEDVGGGFGGVILVSGDNTTVTFDDQVTNNGVLDLAPNISLVTLLEGLTMGGSGALSTTFGGRPTGQEISHISAVGDIVLDGLLEASLFATGTNQFAPQPGDEFEILSTAGELIGDFADVLLPTQIANMGFVGVPDYGLDAYFIRAFSTLMAIGADFDGSGLVDEIDLLIWEQNVGNPGGLGDANNDGIVDSDDYFIWQIQFGGPGVPVPGAGGGAGSGSFGGGAVPEPSSMVMLLSGALLALMAPRRGRPSC